MKIYWEAALRHGTSLEREGGGRQEGTKISGYIGKGSTTPGLETLGLGAEYAR